MPRLCLSWVYLAKHTLISCSCVLFHIYFDIWSNKPYFISNNSWKYLETCVDFFVSHLHLLFFFYFFFYYILNLLTISVKCKYVKECFFFFLKKEQIIKSVKKNKKKDIEKLFFSSFKIQFLWIYSFTSKSWISHFLSFIIFTNVRVENICDKCSRR